MTAYSFILNGEQVSVDVDGSVRLLWVLRDVLGVTGPKHGCALDVCKACTCHINGKAFNPCSVQVSDIQPTDEITTIEGLAATAGATTSAAGLHPMQEAWLDSDVPQCGYCQPGQIMAAVALVKQAQANGTTVSDADIDGLRNICRCGTYVRIREAIKAGAQNMQLSPGGTTPSGSDHSAFPGDTPGPPSPDARPMAQTAIISATR